MSVDLLPCPECGSPPREEFFEWRYDGKFFLIRPKQQVPPAHISALICSGSTLLKGKCTRTRIYRTAEAWNEAAKP